MANYDTMKDSGYEHYAFLNGEHILRHKETGKLERWFANKNHASYGIIYKNTHLEFAASVGE